MRGRDEASGRFAPGSEVALRSVNTYGRHGVAVGFTVAGRVLEDTEHVTVLATPVGSDVRRRAGRGSGPNGRLVVPSDWDGSYVEATWFGAPVVRVRRGDTPWSVWRWHDGADWMPDWYVNLELPWARTPLGFDSQDWTLDVVAREEPDGRWHAWFKDEDELEFYASTGEWSAHLADEVRRVGADAHRAATARAWPFDADWSAWVPDPAWRPVRLPTGWDRVEA